MELVYPNNDRRTLKAENTTERISANALMRAAIQNRRARGDFEATRSLVNRGLLLGYGSQNDKAKESGH